MLVGAAIVIIVLALALGGGGGKGPAMPSSQRSSPIPVHERTVTALQENDPQDLYDELSPSMKRLVSADSFIAAENETDASSGKVVGVQVLQPLTVLTGPEWNSEWAQAEVRVVREQATQDYIVRYVLEEDQWWLFLTIPE